MKLFAQQIGTYLLISWVLDDFMSRLAFSFGLVRAMGGYLKYPIVPGAPHTKEVMAKKFENLGCQPNF